MKRNLAKSGTYPQYVPLRQTLEALFQCKSVNEQFDKMLNREKRSEIFKDIWDGKTITEEDMQHDPSLGLILYQDSSEVANPLGSGRKKHNILAVYLTLADLQPHRSTIDQMQLVLLCREQDFGQNVVFERLMKDLNDIEVNGIVF